MSRAHNLLWDFRVEYSGTWLQRLSPADVSTAELARRCSCGMDIIDVKCAHAANSILVGNNRLWQSKSGEEERESDQMWARRLSLNPK